MASRRSIRTGRTCARIGHDVPADSLLCSRCGWVLTVEPGSCSRQLLVRDYRVVRIDWRHRPARQRLTRSEARTIREALSAPLKAERRTTCVRRVQYPRPLL